MAVAYSCALLSVVMPACGPTPPCGICGNGTPGPYMKGVETVDASQRPDGIVEEGDDLTFRPSSVTIAIGGQVRWTNGGSTPHNVTFNEAVRPSDTMNAGSDFQVRFKVAGTFHYFCTFHAPGMAGTVVVTR